MSVQFDPLETVTYFTEHFWESNGPIDFFRRIFSFEESSTYVRPKIHKVEKSVTLEKMSENPTFHELLRRIPDSERSTLSTTLSMVQREKREELEQFEHALKEGAWKDPIFQDENFPFYALVALGRGNISTSEFTTVQIFWSLIQEQGIDAIEVVPLFNENDESVNPEAKEHLRTSLQSQIILSPKQLNELIANMRNAPEAEKHIFVFRAEYKEGCIAKRIPGTLFDLGKGMKMLPSLSLMQELLNIKFKGNAVEINPVLSHSSLTDIQNNGKNNQRDMGIPFPGIELPAQADGLDAPWFQFLMHDFYHACICSAIPSAYRALYIQMSHEIEKFIEKSTPDTCNQNLEDLKVALIDMEATFFSKENSTGHFKVFWISIMEFLKASICTLTQKEDSLLEMFTKLIKPVKGLEEGLQQELQSWIVRNGIEDGEEEEALKTHPLYPFRMKMHELSEGRMSPPGPS